MPHEVADLHGLGDGRLAHTPQRPLGIALQPLVDAAVRIGPTAGSMLVLLGLGGEPTYFVSTDPTDVQDEWPDPQRLLRLFDAAGAFTVVLLDDVSEIAVRPPSARRAFVGAPVHVDGELLGALCVLGQDGLAFSGDHALRLQTLAREAALIVANACLTWQVVERDRRARTCIEFGRFLTSRLSPREVADAAARTVVEAIDGSRATIWLEQATGGLGVEGWAADRGRTAVLARDELRPREAPDSVVRAFRRGMRTYSRGGAGTSPPEAPRATSCLDLPLKVRERVIGVLSVTVDCRALSPDEEQMATLVADHVALALHSSCLTSEEERYRAEVEDLTELQRAVRSAATLEGALVNIADAARTACGADAAGVAMANPATGRVYRAWRGLRVLAADRHRLQWRNGLAGYVAHTEKLLHSDRAAEDLRLPVAFRTLCGREQITGVLAAPIPTLDRVRGVVYVDRRGGRPFTPADERALERVAEHAVTGVATLLLRQARDRTRAVLHHLRAIVRTVADDAHSLLVQDAVDGLRALVDASLAAVYEISEPHREFTCVAISRAPSGLDVRDVWPADRQLIERTLRTRQTTVREDLRAVDRPPRRPSRTARRRVLLVAPILLAQQPVGVLAVWDVGGRRFSPDEVQLVETTADHLRLVLPRYGSAAVARQQGREARAQ